MSLNDRIRILVVHEDPVARVGLCAALARYADLDPTEAVEAMRGDVDAVIASRPDRADVVVASHALGTTLAAQAKQVTRSTARIVIVGGIDREWAIRGALESGVRGYLLAGCAFDELAACMRSVHRGARYLSAQASIRLAESVSVEALTPREEEVLLLVVEGLCNKAIARRLEIAVGTVKSHLKSTFEKLQVGSRTQAVAAVERRGLLSDARRAIFDLEAAATPVAVLH